MMGTEESVTIGWRHDRDDGVTTVTGEGRFDGRAADHLRDVLTVVTSTGNGRGDVVVDLRSASQLPPDVATALQDAGEQLRRRGRRLSVVTGAAPNLATDR